MKKIAIVFAALVAWIAVNLCCGRILGGFNWDITNNKQYTLDKVSKEIVQNLQEPIIFRIYVSDNLKPFDREHYNYVGHVTNLLSQYQRLNSKKIGMEIVRVKPYSNEAQLAEEIGIKAIPFNDEYAYAGLQVIGMEKQRIISELVPGREIYFENDINRILIDFQNEDKPIVGIVSSEMPIFENTEKNKVWSLIDELSEDYKFMRVMENAVYIPQDVKVLIVLNPKELSSTFLYALDQYLMYGGKVIVFVDPYSEVEQFYKGYPPRIKNNIQSLLRQWGIVYDYQKVVGSFAKALQVDGEVRYPLWFFVENNAKQKLHFRSAGVLEIEPNSGNDIKYDILVKSPDDSGVIRAEELRYTPKKNIIEIFQGGSQAYNLVIKATGKFLSSYTHGLYDGTKYESEIPPFAPVATDDSALVVVADSDFVSDDTWVLESDIKNPIYGSVPYADNAEFVISLINGLLKDDAKIGSVADLKHKNSRSIAEAVSEPMLAVYAKRQSELKTKYNLLQEQLREKKVLVKIVAGKQKLELQKEIDDLDRAAQKVLNELKRASNEFGNVTEAKLNRLLWSNIVICPVLILLLIMVLVKWQRKSSLRRL